MTTTTLSVPNIELISTNGPVNLAKLKGKNIVLYFYPKDSTPGCTTESKGFRDHHQEFEKHNTLVFGVSRDSLASHEKFKCKHDMPFELIVDDEEKLCKHFDVIGDKTFFGKIIRGIVRSTFLIDTKGNVIKEWRKVRVKGHVEAVLDEVMRISS